MIIKKIKDRVVAVVDVDLRFFKKELPVLVFMVMSLISGSVFIKNIGTFSGPDLNGLHYKSSLALATGQVFQDVNKYGYSKRSTISGSENYFSSGSLCINNTLVADVIENPLRSDNLNSCIREGDRTLSSSKTVEAPAVMQYPLFGYTPQAVALRIGMLLNAEPIDAQTLARYFNLFTYIVLIILSIKIIPKGKWLLVVLALLPTSLFLASSLSSDSLNIAWSFVFVAYIAKLYIQKRKITPRQIAIISILGVGLFMLKVAYSPLLLLILALNKSSTPNKTKWLLFAGIFSVGATMYLIWSKNWGSLSAIVDTSDNLRAIVSSPIKALAGVLVGVIYTPLRLFDANRTLYIMLTTIVILTALVSIRNIKPVFPDRLLNFMRAYKLQILATLAVLGSLGLTYIALLLTWTNIGADGFLNIQGFQGRYVLPLLPLTLLIYYVPTRGYNTRGHLNGIH